MSDKTVGMIVGLIGVLTFAQGALADLGDDLPALAIQHEGADLSALQAAMMTAKNEVLPARKALMALASTDSGLKTDTFEATGDLDQVVGTGTLSFRFNVNVPYTEIVSATLYINAYDVDYPESSEHDKIYFNGTYVDRLTGKNGTYVEKSYSISPKLVKCPARSGETAVNTFQLAVNVDNNGWVTGVGSARLVVSGRVFSIWASHDDCRKITVEWTKDGLCYDLYRRKTECGTWTKIAQNVVSSRYDDADTSYGYDYHYYVVESRTTEAKVITAMSLGASARSSSSHDGHPIAVGFRKGAGTAPKISCELPQSGGWLSEMGAKRIRVTWNMYDESKYRVSLIRFKLSPPAGGQCPGRKLR